MRFHYSPKIYILILALCLGATGFTVARLASAANYQDSQPFRVQFSRLAPLQPHLAKAAKVGYLTNVSNENDAYTRLYFPTQYVLAPTLLVPLEMKPDVDLVVGNFTRQEDYKAIGQQHGLDLVQEFPMGVVLYRRAQGAKP